MLKEREIRSAIDRIERGDKSAIDELLEKTIPPRSALQGEESGRYIDQYKWEIYKKGYRLGIWEGIKYLRYKEGWNKIGLWGRIMYLFNKGPANRALKKIFIPEDVPDDLGIPMPFMKADIDMLAAQDYIPGCCNYTDMPIRPGAHVHYGPGEDYHQKPVSVEKS